MDIHPGGMMKQFVVRRVRSTDVAAFRDLRLRSLATDPMAFGSTLARETAYDDEQWADRVRSSIDSSDEGVWVAEEEAGRLVGMIGAFTKDGVRHVYGMWVEPARRGSGVGGQLLDTLIAWVGSTGGPRTILLSVNPSQEAAVRLYRRRGFRPTGVVEPLGHTPGAVVHGMRRDGPSPVGEPSP
jgi:ribosomal protein S18 acetylase RimI-like enzyme